MVLGFTSNSGSNLKLEFISYFAVGVQLQKSQVFRVGGFFGLVFFFRYILRCFRII